MSSPYKTVALYTFGCKANFADTSLLNATFVKKGYSIIPFGNIADVYVINTCSVTDNANKKCRKLIRNLKERAPESIIGVTGCYAQLKPQEIIGIPEVNFVAGMHDKYNFVDKIKNISLDQKLLFHSNDVQSIEDAFLAYSLNERTRSFVKVQDGCDYSCSYCTIPKARGKSRSVRIKEIIEHINNLENNNINEIILSGINVGDFGVENNESLLMLLKEINKHSSISRIRISSIEPNLLTEDIIDFIALNQKFMPHLHIPLQSGSNKILRKMRRRYSVESYSNIILKVKEKIKDCTIGADVMVGFPSETEKHFNETYDLLNDLPISYLHVFPFSERENTLAANMVDSVDMDVRFSRAKVLRKLSETKFQKVCENNIGLTRSVIFEMIDEYGNISGLTDNYIRVQVQNNPNIKVNNVADVKLKCVDLGQMIGDIRYD